jgi:glycerate kinase
MLDICGFDNLAADCYIVITGEGKTDFQPAHGKLPAAVVAAAKRRGIPVVCICGAANPVDALYECGIDGIFAIPDSPMALEDSMANAARLITNTCRNVAGLIRSVEQRK